MNLAYEPGQRASATQGEHFEGRNIESCVRQLRLPELRRSANTRIADRRLPLRLGSGRKRDDAKGQLRNKTDRDDLPSRVLEATQMTRGRV